MVNRIVLAVVVLLMTAPYAGATVEVCGEQFPEKVTVNGEKLVLNGAGLREKYFIGVDVYVAGLYLKERTTDAEEIINADETMMLKIKIVSGLVSSEKFKEATMVGFEASTDGNTAPIQEEITLFMRAFADEINKGDVFDIQYVPDQGIFVFKNDRPKPEVIVEGLSVKKALFGIWLCDREEKHLQVLAEGLLGK